jgi:hypothetical protein
MLVEIPEQPRGLTMYRIEFVKIDLEAQDETIGEVDVRKVHGELKVFGVTERTGIECHYESDAKSLAKQFEDGYSKWPEKYKVTTEVYKTKGEK